MGLFDPSPIVGSQGADLGNVLAESWANMRRVQAMSSQYGPAYATLSPVDVANIGHTNAETNTLIPAQAANLNAEANYTAGPRTAETYATAGKTNVETAAGQQTVNQNQAEAFAQASRQGIFALANDPRTDGSPTDREAAWGDVSKALTARNPNMKAADLENMHQQYLQGGSTYLKNLAAQDSATNPIFRDPKNYVSYQQYAPEINDKISKLNQDFLKQTGAKEGEGPAELQARTAASNNYLGTAQLQQKNLQAADDLIQGTNLSGTNPKNERVADNFAYRYGATRKPGSTEWKVGQLLDSIHDNASVLENATAKQYAGVSTSRSQQAFEAQGNAVFVHADEHGNFDPKMLHQQIGQYGNYLHSAIEGETDEKTGDHMAGIRDVASTRAANDKKVADWFKDPTHSPTIQMPPLGVVTNPYNIAKTYGPGAQPGASPFPQGPVQGNMNVPNPGPPVPSNFVKNAPGEMSQAARDAVVNAATAQAAQSGAPNWKVQAVRLQAAQATQKAAIEALRKNYTSPK